MHVITYHISLKIDKNVFLSSLHISLNVVICAIIFLDRSKLHFKNSVLTPIFQSFTVQFWFLFFVIFLLLRGISYYWYWFSKLVWKVQMISSCSAVILPRKYFMIFLYMPFFSKSGLRDFKSSISSLLRWFSL